jgi:hypothetical protein
MYGITPPPERMPEAIMLGAIGLGIIYLALKIFIKWVSRQ